MNQTAFVTRMNADEIGGILDAFAHKGHPTHRVHIKAGDGLTIGSVDAWSYAMAETFAAQFAALPYPKTVEIETLPQGLAFSGFPLANEYIARILSNITPARLEWLRNRPEYVNDPYEAFLPLMFEEDGLYTDCDIWIAETVAKYLGDYGVTAIEDSDEVLAMITTYSKAFTEEACKIIRGRK